MKTMYSSVASGGMDVHHTFSNVTFRDANAQIVRRERLRYRADLVGVQTQIKNRIHAIFHRHGIFHDVSDLFGVKGRAFLVALCQNGSEHLSPSALAVLQGQVTLLNEVRRHRRSRPARQAARPAPGPSRQPDVEMGVHRSRSRRGPLRGEVASDVRPLYRQRKNKLQPRVHQSRPPMSQSGVCRMDKAGALHRHAAVSSGPEKTSRTVSFGNGPALPP